MKAFLIFFSIFNLLLLSIISTTLSKPTLTLSRKDGTPCTIICYICPNPCLPRPPLPPPIPPPPPPSPPPIPPSPPPPSPTPPALPLCPPPPPPPKPSPSPPPPKPPLPPPCYPCTIPPIIVLPPPNPLTPPVYVPPNDGGELYGPPGSDNNPVPYVPNPPNIFPPTPPYPDGSSSNFDVHALLQSTVFAVIVGLSVIMFLY